MRKLILAAASALAIAVPGTAGAQIFHEDMDDAIVAAIPPAERVEEYGHAMDRVLGAVLDLDIAPLADALDPYGRERRYHRGERTVRDMAGRDDPYFEDRMRHSLYGVTANLGGMMEALAVVAPVMRRSLADLERNVEEAMREGRARGRPYR
ncbi:MAG: hypothetical protein ACK4K7_04350 [Allosphingosinicella sp.]|uniref:hypothetical protein n=1 Tax=Allosphingosinicella sp. TaxID=2823234 RepID=UPI00394CAE40